MWPAVRERPFRFVCSMYLIVCTMYVYPFAFVAIATLVQLILTTNYIKFVESKLDIGIVNKVGFILQSSIVLGQDTYYKPKSSLLSQLAT